MARKRGHRAGGWKAERGQASVEFLGILPAALLVSFAGWQLAVAGQAVWLAGNAARVAARAQAVGADPRAAARRALPSYLRKGTAVRGDGRRVSVRIAVPLVVGSRRTPLAVRANAALEQR